MVSSALVYFTSTAVLTALTYNCFGHVFPVSESMFEVHGEKEFCSKNFDD